jgi:hypothetical protein
VKVDFTGDPAVYRDVGEYLEWGEMYYGGEKTEDELKAMWEEELEEYGEHDVIHESNVFLTEKGYREHVELNGHNIQGHSNYLKHAFRNPEMASLVKIIRAFKDI